MARILINLQFYPGDRTRAGKLAKYIAALEPEPRRDVVFLFNARRDARHNMLVVEAVSQKFPTELFTCRRFGAGWPAGPNDQLFDSFCYLHEQYNSGNWQPFDCVFCLEPDDVPLSRDWIDALVEEWKGSRRPVIMGHYQTVPSPHINGNAVLSGDPDFVKWMHDRGGFLPGIGWDMSLAGDFKKRGWSPTSIIRSDYAMPTCPPAYAAELVERGVVLHHGVKDESLLNWALDRFIVRKPFLG